MPYRPMRPCPHPGCSALVPSGYCQEHAALHVRQYHSRPDPRERGYGPAWQNKSARILRERQTCEWCNNRARTVDHVTPVDEGGTDDDLNLQALCWSCHNRKTYAQNNGGEVVFTNRDGSKRIVYARPRPAGDTRSQLLDPKEYTHATRSFYPSTNPKVQAGSADGGQ